MADETRKPGFFRDLVNKIESRDDALRLAKDCGIAFFVVAAIDAIVGAFFAPFMLIDAAIFALCGYFVGFKQSRVAAVVAVLLAGAALVTAVLNKMGPDVGGGKNVILGLIMVVAAARGVEATFKLAGRFKS